MSDPTQDRRDLRQDVTHALAEVSAGVPEADTRLLELVYGELKRLAAAKMATQEAWHTLQPTALVHEAYLRLLGGKVDAQAFRGSAHFFSAAAGAMRSILVDHVRRKRAGKRGHGAVQVALHPDVLELAAECEPLDRILAVHEALGSLAKEHARPAKVVELLFFAGLTAEEAAGVLCVSDRTVKHCLGGLRRHGAPVGPARGGGRPPARAPAAFVRDLAFSPDGGLLATASYDRTVKLIDTHTWAVRSTLADHGGRVSSIAFSPDGTTVATASIDRLVRLWDTAGALLRRLEGHEEGVHAVAFAPRGSWLVSGGMDGRALVRETERFEIVATLEHKSGLQQLAFAPDGRRLAAVAEGEPISGTCCRRACCGARIPPAGCTTWPLPPTGPGLRPRPASTAGAPRE